MKKIASLISAVILLGQLTSTTHTYAATPTDPKTNLSIECNSTAKPALLGFTGKANEPNNGPLIIAGNYKLKISAVTPSVADDLSTVNLTANDAQYLKLILAENRVARSGNDYIIDITFGFTGQEAINHANDLFFINFPANQKARITVESAQLFGLSGSSNLYQPHDPKESFMYDLATCATLAQANEGSPDPASQIAPEINFNAPASAERGDEVNIAAMIGNVNTFNIAWVQTEGPAITPTIDNDEEFMLSELNFTIPDDSPNNSQFTFEVTVTNTENNLQTKKNVTVQVRGDLAGTADTASTNRNTLNNNAQASILNNQAQNIETTQNNSLSLTPLATTTALTPANVDSSASTTTVTNTPATPTTTVTPSTIHGTASLADSGPTETGILFLASLTVALIYIKTRRAHKS